MFEFALLASWKPAHDDWLNDRSSTPPVSSTMQALKAWPEALAVLPDPEDAPPPALLLAGLLPQPATSIPVTATAAVTLNSLCKGLPFCAEGPSWPRRATLAAGTGRIGH